MKSTILYSLSVEGQGLIYFDLMDLFDKDRLKRICNDFYSKEEFIKELINAVDKIEIEFHQAYYSDYCEGFVFIKTNWDHFYDKTEFPLVKYKEQGYRLSEENLTYDYFTSQEEARKNIEELKKDIKDFINEIE